MHRLRVQIPVAVAMVAAVLMGGAAPASAKTWAPQPVDTTQEGALGFVIMAAMVGIIAASLFFMDRIRQRKSGGRD